jgi:Mn2+/Fe2+ NRAMP family transporter
MSKSKPKTRLQRARYRLVTSALAGVLAAAVLVTAGVRTHHAAVAAAVAAHQSTGAYLAAVFGGVVLAVTVGGFIVSSIVAMARPRPDTGQSQASGRRRSFGAGAGW